MEICLCKRAWRSLYKIDFKWNWYTRFRPRQEHSSNGFISYKYLDNVIIIKSSTAENPADFTGGIINVVTKEFPTNKQLSISIGTSYNPNMHYINNFIGYEGGKTDFRVWWWN